MTADERAAILAPIDALEPWVSAKSYARTAPHEWSRRRPETEAAYVDLFTAIRQHGVREKWGDRWYRYLYPGDGYKYWAMTGNVAQSRIVDRARCEGFTLSAPVALGVQRPI